MTNPYLYPFDAPVGGDRYHSGHRSYCCHSWTGVLHLGSGWRTGGERRDFAFVGTVGRGLGLRAREAARSTVETGMSPTREMDGDDVDAGSTQVHGSA